MNANKDTDALRINCPVLRDLQSRFGHLAFDVQLRLCSGISESLCSNPSDFNGDVTGVRQTGNARANLLVLMSPTP